MFCMSPPTIYSFVQYLLRTFHVSSVYSFIGIQKKNLKRHTPTSKWFSTLGYMKKATLLGSECAAIGEEQDTEGTQRRNT